MPPRSAIRAIRPSKATDFPDQVAFSKPANSRITRHSADSAKLLGYEGRFRAHTGGRGRAFTAGVAAANYNDVELMGHQNLGCRVLADARGGVKIIGFKENVSRETLRKRPRTRAHLRCLFDPAPVENAATDTARRYCRI